MVTFNIKSLAKFAANVGVTRFDFSVHNIGA